MPARPASLLATRRRNWRTDLEMIKARLPASQPVLSAPGRRRHGPCGLYLDRGPQCRGDRQPHSEHTCCRAFLVVPEEAPDPVHHYPSPLAQAE